MTTTTQVNPWLLTNSPLIGVVTRVYRNYSDPSGNSLARVFLLSKQEQMMLFDPNSASSATSSSSSSSSSQSSSILSMLRRSGTDLVPVSRINEGIRGPVALCDEGVADVVKGSRAVGAQEYQEAAGPSHIVWVEGVFARRLPFYVTVMYQKVHVKPSARGEGGGVKELQPVFFDHQLSAAKTVRVMSVVVTEQYIPGSFVAHLTRWDSIVDLCTHTGVFDECPQEIGAPGSLQVQRPLPFKDKRENVERALAPLHGAFQMLGSDPSMNQANWIADKINDLAKISSTVSQSLKTAVPAQRGAASGCATSSTTATSDIPILMEQEWSRSLEPVLPSSIELIVDRKTEQAIKSWSPPHGTETFDALFGSCSDRLPPLSVFFLRASSLSIADDVANVSARSEFSRVIPLRFIVGNGRGLAIPGTSNAISVSVSDLVELQSMLVVCQCLADAAVEMLRGNGIEAFSHGALLRRAGAIQRELASHELMMHANQLLANQQNAHLWILALRFLTSNVIDKFPGWRLPRPLFTEIGRAGSSLLHLTIVADVYHKVHQLIEPFLGSGGAAAADAHIDKRLICGESLLLTPLINVVGENLVSLLRTTTQELILQPYRAEVPFDSIAALCELCDSPTPLFTAHQPKIVVISCLPATQRGMSIIPGSLYSAYTFPENFSDFMCQSIQLLVIVGAEQMDIVTFSAILQKFKNVPGHCSALRKIVLMFDSIVSAPIPSRTNVATPLRHIPQFFCPVVEALLYSSAFSVLPGLPVNENASSAALRFRNLVTTAAAAPEAPQDPAGPHLIWTSPPRDDIVITPPFETKEFTDLIIDLMEDNVEDQQKKNPVLFVDTSVDFSWVRNTAPPLVKKTNFPRLLTKVCETINNVLTQANQTNTDLCPQFRSILMHGPADVASATAESFQVGSIVSWTTQAVEPSSLYVFHAGLYVITSMTSAVSTVELTSNLSLCLPVHTFDPANTKNVEDALVSAGRRLGRNVVLLITLRPLDGGQDSPSRLSLKLMLPVIGDAGGGGAATTAVKVPLRLVTIVSSQDLATIEMIDTMFCLFDTNVPGSAIRVLHALKHCNRRAIICTSNPVAARELLQNAADEAIISRLQHNNVIPASHFPLATLIRNEVASAEVGREYERPSAVAVGGGNKRKLSSSSSL
jgi:hypothetical protein